MHYNKGVKKSNINLKEDEKVYIQAKFTKNWSKDTVIKKLNDPRQQRI